MKCLVTINPGDVVFSLPTETSMVWKRVDDNGTPVGPVTWLDATEPMLVIARGVIPVSHIIHVVVRGTLGYVYCRQVKRLF